MYIYGKYSLPFGGLHLHSINSLFCNMQAFNFYISFISEHVYVCTYIYHSIHKGHRTTYSSLLSPSTMWVL